MSQDWNIAPQDQTTVSIVPDLKTTNFKPVYNLAIPGTHPQSQAKLAKGADQAKSLMCGFPTIKFYAWSLRGVSLCLGPMEAEIQWR